MPKTLVWHREAAIGGTGRVSSAAAAFAGTLATRAALASQLTRRLRNALHAIAADADKLLASIPSDGPTRVDIGQGDRGASAAAASNPLEAALRNKLGITT